MMSRLELAARLTSAAATSLPSVAIGFDGFVDEMISVVHQRQNLASFTAVPDIATLGKLITASAGHSSLHEIVVNAVHPGGCAINLGDGLAALGVPVDAFATLGQPVHPAFAPIVANFRSAHSWGREPGRTLAFEFHDGKLMFSAVSPLTEFTPALVADRLADGAYAAACARARVIALTNWTLYPHMTAVWQWLQEKVFASLTHRPAFFIDLVDPTSRAPEDIHTMLATLPAFSAIGPVTLSLNGTEANVLARFLNLPIVENDPAPESVQHQAQSLRENLALAEVVIHRRPFATVATAQEVALEFSVHCAQPKKSTGAGDRFNAGYCLGQLLNLDAPDRLTCAHATAGHFIRQARSPSLPELIHFLKSM